MKNNLLVAGVGGAPHVEEPLFQDVALRESRTLSAVDAGFLDVEHWDYRLRPDSPAIGAGIEPGPAGGLSLIPAVQYVHPTHTDPIHPTMPPDIGAYQYRP